MQKLIVVLWMSVGMYVAVFAAILTDLWAGVRKAKKNKIMRSSWGFRRTIDKMAKYYNVMLALTVIDVMQMALFWYLEKYYGWCVPILPVMTLIGAIGICLIEIKSIYEKAENKVNIDSLATMTGKILNDREDMSKVVKDVVDYITSDEYKLKQIKKDETKTKEDLQG